MGLRGAVTAADGTVMKPSIWGKLKANVQFLAILLAIVRTSEPWGPLYPDQYAMLAAAAVTVGSAVEYFARFGGVLIGQTRAIAERAGPRLPHRWQRLRRRRAPAPTRRGRTRGANARPLPRRGRRRRGMRGSSGPRGPLRRRGARARHAGLRHGVPRGRRERDVRARSGSHVPHERRRVRVGGAGCRPRGRRARRATRRRRRRSARHAAWSAPRTPRIAARSCRRTSDPSSSPSSGCFALGADLGVEVVCVNPSSVQGPGRTEGSARLLIGLVNARSPVIVRHVPVDRRHRRLHAGSSGRRGARPARRALPAERREPDHPPRDRARAGDRGQTPPRHPPAAGGSVGSGRRCRLGVADDASRPARSARSSLGRCSTATDTTDPARRASWASPIDAIEDTVARTLALVRGARADPIVGRRTMTHRHDRSIDNGGPGDD